MKKFVSILSIAALLLTATTVFASENKGRGEVKARAGIKAEFNGLIKGLRLGNDKLVVAGTVKSKTAVSMVITLQNPKTSGQDMTIVLNSDTDFEVNNSDDDSLGNIKVGDRVLVKGNLNVSSTGTVNNFVFTATEVKVLGGSEAKVKAERGVALGSVTAKTDTSITIKNTITGDEKTLTVNPDTQVRVNGETKAVSDVQVGDRGWVKFKTEASVLIAKFINIFR